MAQRTGALVFDERTDRYDIRFDLAESTEAGERRSFSEQDSTAVPKFAYRSFCPCGNLVGECLPQTLLMRLTPLENPSK